MRHTTYIPIEHVVVASNQPFEDVIDALEARLGVAENWGEIVQQLIAARASWEQVTQTIEEHIGTSGLTFFSKVEHSPLLSLVGKTSRANQYTIGNPLFAVQMTQHMPEAALYAPLKLVVYEDEEGSYLCGTDLWPYRGQGQYQPGWQIGHEWMGIVEDIGSQVRTIKRGDRVIAPYDFFDGTCEFCRKGLDSSVMSEGEWLFLVSTLMFRLISCQSACRLGSCDLHGMWLARLPALLRKNLV